jgi:guanylate kinase
MKGSLIIFSAPSGSGKSTLIGHLLKSAHDVQFSVSATTRQPRGNETNGKEYFFMGVDEFKNGVNSGQFLEWQEVYPNQFYGTLKSNVERMLNDGKSVLLDVDVKGGLNIKKEIGENSLSIYVDAGDIDVLEARLRGRGTDTEESIKMRISKAVEEQKLSKYFDWILPNKDLDVACDELVKGVAKYL